MSHSSLDGCWAKIERANENVKNLELEIQRWGSTDPKPYRVVGQLDPEQRAYIFTAIGGPIPLRFSVLTGEIVHHLRSSLDHVVWALALRRNPNPPTKLHFPICDTPEKFKTACERGEIKGLPPSARAIIDAEQPYRKADPRGASLAVLNRLSNTDKHRLLLVVSNVVVLGDQIDIDGGEHNATEIIGFGAPPELNRLQASENGTEVFRVQFGRFSPKAKVKADFTVIIALDELGPQKREAIIPTLIHLRDSVVNTIKLFEGEF